MDKLSNTKLDDDMELFIENIKILFLKYTKIRLIQYLDFSQVLFLHKNIWKISKFKFKK